MFWFLLAAEHLCEITSQEPPEAGSEEELFAPRALESLLLTTAAPAQDL